MMDGEPLYINGSIVHDGVYEYDYPANNVFFITVYPGVRRI